MDLTDPKDVTNHNLSSLDIQPIPGHERHDVSSAGKQVEVRFFDSVRQTHHEVTVEDLPGPQRLKSGAPIAQVLNIDSPLLQGTLPVAAVFAPPAPPFSGRLADLLLDPLEAETGRAEQYVPPPSIEATGTGSSVITLPKLPQLPVKTVKRPRIPPLLQGLHQPPPLPTGRLFPPITSDQNAFSETPSERRTFELQHVTPIGPGNSDRARQTLDTATLPVHVQQLSSGSEARAVGGGTTAERPEHPSRILSLEEPHATITDQASTKPSRKRKRWSEDETRDLLLGVSRFGIGNWKKILQCPDFTFEGRTAVDLKDRFRVCRPGDGLKQRKAKDKHKDDATEGLSPPGTVTKATTQASSFAQIASTGNGRGLTSLTMTEEPISKSSLTDSNLAELGIRAPFARNARRPRREFTEQDDVKLLKGFERHGPSWHSIRDDTELGFNTRHPTDLRDRFRIKYPSKYAKAGYKLKKKVSVHISDPSQNETEKNMASEEPIHRSNDMSPSEPRSFSVDFRKAGLTKPDIVTPKSKPPHSQGKTRDPLTLLLRPLPILADDNDTAHDYSFNDEDPPTLNRDILQWAEASSSSTTLGPPAVNSHNHDFVHSDMPWNLFVPSDLFHINSTSMPFHNDTSPSSKDRYHTKAPDRLAYPTTTSPVKAVTSSSSNLTVPGAINNSSNNRNAMMPQTPNLPNIVFPHVPAASARNTVHNLPGPADLLSVDLDRPLPQSLGTTLDDALGFVNSA